MENYQVLRQIGKGSFGTADLVVDKRDKPRQYILKRTRLARQLEEQREATVQEMFLQKEIRHRNVVWCKESWLDKGYIACLVLEYCLHGELEYLLRDSRGKYFPESVVMEMFVQMVSCLEHLHRNNIVHRDIKAANVFIRADYSLALGDFGLSQADCSSETLVSTKLGTPQHMAPELLGKSPRYSDKSDIWALGVLFFEITALHSPFKAFNMQGLTSKIMKAQVPPLPDFYSDNWKGIVKSCLAKDPGKRPSAAELLRQPFLQQVVHSVNSKYGPAIPDGAPGGPICVPTAKMQEVMDMLDKKKVKSNGDSGNLGTESDSKKAPVSRDRPPRAAKSKAEKEQESLDLLAAKISAGSYKAEADDGQAAASKPTPAKTKVAARPSQAAHREAPPVARRGVPSVPRGSGLGGGRSPLASKKPAAAKSTKATEQKGDGAKPAESKKEAAFPSSKPKIQADKPKVTQQPTKGASTTSTSKMESEAKKPKTKTGTASKAASSKTATSPVILNINQGVDIRTIRKPSVPVEPRASKGIKQTGPLAKPAVLKGKQTAGPASAKKPSDVQPSASLPATNNEEAPYGRSSVCKDSAFSPEGKPKSEGRAGIMAQVKQPPAGKKAAPVPGKPAAVKLVSSAKPAQAAKPSDSSKTSRLNGSTTTKDTREPSSLGAEGSTQDLVPSLKRAGGDDTAAANDSDSSYGRSVNTADSASSHYGADTEATSKGMAEETIGDVTLKQVPQQSCSPAAKSMPVPRGGSSIRPKVGGGGALNDTAAPQAGGAVNQEGKPAANASLTSPPARVISNIRAGSKPLGGTRGTNYTPVITLKAAPRPGKKGACAISSSGSRDPQADGEAGGAEIHIAGHPPMSKWSPGFGTMLNEVISIAESRAPTSGLPAKQAKFVERYRTLLKE